HFLFAAGQEKFAILNEAEVSGVEPAAADEGLGVSLRVVQITRSDDRPFNLEPADDPLRDQPVNAVGDADGNARHRSAKADELDAFSGGFLSELELGIER